MLLENQIALVTGASRGIGAAIANALAAEGARVIGTATSASGAAAINDRLAAVNGAGRVLNVTEEGAVEALIDSIAAEFGDVAILVNNAGITRDNLLMRMKDDDWDAIMNTNLKSVFKASRAVLRGMMKARSGTSSTSPRLSAPWVMPGRPITLRLKRVSWALPNRWREKSAAVILPSTVLPPALSTPT